MLYSPQILSNGRNCSSFKTMPLVTSSSNCKFDYDGNNILSMRFKPIGKSVKMEARCLMWRTYELMRNGQTIIYHVKVYVTLSESPQLHLHVHSNRHHLLFALTLHKDDKESIQWSYQKQHRCPKATRKQQIYYITIAQSLSNYFF